MRLHLRINMAVNPSQNKCIVWLHISSSADLDPKWRCSHGCVTLGAIRDTPWWDSILFPLKRKSVPLVPYPTTGHVKSITQWEIDKLKSKASLGYVCKVCNSQPECASPATFSERLGLTNQSLESRNLKVTLPASFMALVCTACNIASPHPTVREEQYITHVTKQAL